LIGEETYEVSTRIKMVYDFFLLNTEH